MDCQVCLLRIVRLKHGDPNNLDSSTLVLFKLVL